MKLDLTYIPEKKIQILVRGGQILREACWHSSVHHEEMK